jgi:hypothetical protein
MSVRSSQAISQPEPGRQISGECTPPSLWSAYQAMKRPTGAAASGLARVTE